VQGNPCFCEWYRTIASGHTVLLEFGITGGPHEIHLLPALRLMEKLQEEEAASET
jgi:hypothetical protein